MIELLFTCLVLTSNPAVAGEKDLAALINEAKEVYVTTSTLSMEVEAFQYIRSSEEQEESEIKGTNYEQLVMRTQSFVKRHGDSIDITERIESRDDDTGKLEPSRDGRFISADGLTLQRQNVPGKDYIMASVENTESGSLLSASQSLGGFLEGRFAHHPVDWVSVLEQSPVSAGEDVITGHPCVVLSVSTEWGDYKFWIDIANGYAMRRAEVAVDGNDLAFGGKPLRESKLGFTEMKLTVEDVEVESIEGKFFPVSGRLIEETKTRDGQSVSETVVLRKNVTFEPNFNAGDFHMDLPDGTPIYNFSAPGVKYVWVDGKITPAADEATISAIPLLSQR